MPTFYELKLSEPLTRATLNMGFEETTPIQEKAIPVAMAGRDIIGQAQTGTGKTAAFGIPMIEKIDASAGCIQGLVIAPTRELAVQVAEELNTIGQFKGVKSLPIYGGQAIERQIRALKSRPQIIVATPGRLRDHMGRRTIRLDRVKVAVLDEADEMLNMGFIEDIEKILSEIPTERQTMLFSATMPGPVQKLAKRFMVDPELIKIKTQEVTVSATEQYYIQLHERQKFDALCLLLDIYSPESAIVFCRTKRRVDELYDGLKKRGYTAEAIHGDLTQARRDSVMKNFKEGHTEILAATDVAARGLDISGVTHVFNFDIPQDPESYVHRIGRTGRAGNTGSAVTLVTHREKGHLSLIEQAIKRKIERRPVPSFNEALEGQQRAAIDKLVQTAREGKTQQYLDSAGELLEAEKAEMLLAAALKLLTREPDKTPVKITEEKPQDSKRFKKGERRGGYRRKGGFSNKKNKHYNKRNY